MPKEFDTQIDSLLNLHQGKCATFFLYFWYQLVGSLWLKQLGLGGKGHWIFTWVILRLKNVIIGVKRLGFGLMFDGKMPLLRTENTRKFK